MAIEDTVNDVAESNGKRSVEDNGDEQESLNSAWTHYHHFRRGLGVPHLYMASENLKQAKKDKKMKINQRVIELEGEIQKYGQRLQAYQQEVSQPRVIVHR